ncbi:NADH-quinone oxidoreductase subunit A [Geoalkalibacter halelectricus]|uniref:NADH-quinone oxidoreductase subunit A n=1 Tax=Geoalkalibacter halelectricus TaxID=2847045 RepID=UPI003D20A596
MFLALAVSPVALSTDAPASPEALLSLVLYACLAAALIALLLGAAWLLGRKTHTPLKDAPYESGVAPSGAARMRAPAPFFLVAIFFLIFAVEAVIILSWAVAWDLLGWAGFAQVSFFVLILFVGLAHLWKTGGLDWHPRAQERGRGGGT